MLSQKTIKIIEFAAPVQGGKSAFLLTHILTHMLLRRPVIVVSPDINEAWLKAKCPILEGLVGDTPLTFINPLESPDGLHDSVAAYVGAVVSSDGLVSILFDMPHSYLGVDEEGQPDYSGFDFSKGVDVIISTKQLNREAYVRDNTEKDQRTVFAGMIDVGFEPDGEMPEAAGERLYLSYESRVGGFNTQDKIDAMVPFHELHISEQRIYSMAAMSLQYTIEEVIAIAPTMQRFSKDAVTEWAGHLYEYFKANNFFGGILGTTDFEAGLFATAVDDDVQEQWRRCVLTYLMATDQVERGEVEMKGEEETAANPISKMVLAKAKQLYAKNLADLDHAPVWDDLSEDCRNEWESTAAEKIRGEFADESERPESGVVGALLGLYIRERYHRVSHALFGDEWVVRGDTKRATAIAERLFNEYSMGFGAKHWSESTLQLRQPWVDHVEEYLGHPARTDDLRLYGAERLYSQHCMKEHIDASTNEIINTPCWDELDERTKMEWIEEAKLLGGGNPEEGAQ